MLKVKSLYWLFISSCVVGLVVMVFTSPATASSYKKIKAQLEKTYGLKIRFTKIKPPKYWEPSTSKFWLVPRKARKAALINLKRDLAKYQISTIRNNLRTINIVRMMSRQDTFYAGAVDTNYAVYLTDRYMKEKPAEGAGVFHHEFSSLLLYNHPLKKKFWLRYNPESFEYFMEGKGGLEILNDDRAYIKGSEKTYKQGFLEGYGMMSFHEDFNTFFELYMTDREEMERLAQSYSRIHDKLEVLKYYFKRVQERSKHQDHTLKNIVLDDAPEINLKSIGLTFSELTRYVRKTYHIGPNAEGVAITKVAPQSIAAKKDLLAGSLILEVMHHKVFTPQDVFKRLDRVKKSNRANVILLVLRPDGERVFVSLPLKP